MRATAAASQHPPNMPNKVLPPTRVLPETERLQYFLPGAKETFHFALDELEISIIKAMGVLERDRRVLRGENVAISDAPQVRRGQNVASAARSSELRKDREGDGIQKVQEDLKDLSVTPSTQQLQTSVLPQNQAMPQQRQPTSKLPQATSTTQPQTATPSLPNSQPLPSPALNRPPINVPKTPKMPEDEIAFNSIPVPNQPPQPQAQPPRRIETPILPPQFQQRQQQPQMKQMTQQQAMQRQNSQQSQQSQPSPNKMERQPSQQSQPSPGFKSKVGLNPDWKGLAVEGSPHKKQKLEPPQQTGPNTLQHSASVPVPSVASVQQQDVQQQEKAQSVPPSGQIDGGMDFDFDQFLAQSPTGGGAGNSAENDFNMDDFFNDSMPADTTAGTGAGGDNTGGDSGNNIGGDPSFDLSSFGITTGDSTVMTNNDTSLNIDLDAAAQDSSKPSDNANSSAAPGMTLFDEVRGYAQQADNDDTMDGIDFTSLNSQNADQIMSSLDASAAQSNENNTATAGANDDLNLTDADLNSMGFDTNQESNFDDMWADFNNMDDGNGGQGGNSDGGGNGEVNFDDDFFNMP